MKLKLLIFGGVTIVIVFGISYHLFHKSKLTEYSNAVITLERTLCYGMCPSYEVTIAGDGKVVYNGRAWVKTTGVQQRQIAVDSVQKLIKELLKIDYFSLKDKYIAPVTDNPTVYTSLKLGSRYKRIHDYVAGPKELRTMEHRIDEIAMTEEWTGVKERRRRSDNLWQARQKADSLSH